MDGWVADGWMAGDGSAPGVYHIHIHTYLPIHIPEISAYLLLFALLSFSFCFIHPLSL
jgi:hypothetical protein